MVTSYKYYVVLALRMQILMVILNLYAYSWLNTWNEIRVNNALKSKPAIIRFSPQIAQKVTQKINYMPRVIEYTPGEPCVYSCAKGMTHSKIPH